MAAPILYYWGPCATCALVTSFADEHGIELDKRDVEQVELYNELLALGGNADFIPYLQRSRAMPLTSPSMKSAKSQASRSTIRSLTSRRSSCPLVGRSARSR